jgi:acyl-coenzyme A thioesterase PaaI-like protein
MANRLARTVERLTRLPGGARLTSFALGRAVPMVGASGLVFEEVTPARVVVSLPDRRRVRNHIGGLHAAAMALLAETATGFCVGMSVPDDKLPVIKSMQVRYLKRAQGGMRAVAELTAAEIERLRTEERGEVRVPVTVTDESGRAPIEAELTWAWVPRRR